MLHRIRVGNQVRVRISSIEPSKNRINATIITENESEN